MTTERKSAFLITPRITLGLGVHCIKCKARLIWHNHQFWHGNLAALHACPADKKPVQRESPSLGVAQ